MLAGFKVGQSVGLLSGRIIFFFWMKRFGILRNTFVPFPPGYIHSMPSVELNLINVAWH